METGRRLRTLFRCRRGNVLIVAAATLPLMIAAAAIGLDTIQLTLAKRQLQRSADSAAMAGAYALLMNQTPGSAVDRDLELNNELVLSAPRLVENAPSVGPHAGDERAVRVVLQADRSVPFIAFFTGAPIGIEVEATAAAVPDGNYCVVSLESSAATGITFAGSADIDLGCGVATNSRAATAIRVNGNPAVTASPVAAVGGLPGADEFAGDPVMIPFGPPQPDPFASLANPQVPPSCSDAVSVGPRDDETIDPGCYRGMDIKGSLTLRPGVYVIDGGSLSFGAQAQVSGTGVTFVLTSRNAVSDPGSIATLDMNGGATLNLTAPGAGDYAGVLVYQDRRAPMTGSRINGNSSSVLDGAFYLPSQDITFNGGAGMTVRCLRLVARRITFSGNSALSNSCPDDAPVRGFAGLTVRLVS